MWFFLKRLTHKIGHRMALTCCLIKQILIIENLNMSLVRKSTMQQKQVPKLLDVKS